MANAWSTYEYQPSFVLGFHGCEKNVAEKILSGKEPHLLRSEKKHDWLGHGIYFWEGNPSRALAWAEKRKAEKRSVHHSCWVQSLTYGTALTCLTTMEMPKYAKPTMNW